MVLQTRIGCIAELFSAVIVTEDYKNEDKSQWDDHPKWTDTLGIRIIFTRLSTVGDWKIYTSIHLFLQNGEGRTLGGSRRLYVWDVALSRSHIQYPSETCITYTDKNAGRNELMSGEG